MSHTTETLKAAYRLHSVPGIPFSIFATRVRNLGWSPERAGSVPHTPRSDTVSHYQHLYKRIEAPLVGFDTFCSRLRKNKDPLEAAMTPLFESGVLRKVYDQHPNPAVPYRRFYNRVQFNCWEVDKALTTALVKTSTQKNRKMPTFLGQWYQTNKGRSQVSWKQFASRVRRLGWDKERALITPPVGSPQSSLRSFYNTHQSPAVVYGTFYNRVNMWKWDKDKAISTPAHADTSTTSASKRPQP